MRKTHNAGRLSYPKALTLAAVGLSVSRAGSQDFSFLAPLGAAWRPEGVAPKRGTTVRPLYPSYYLSIGPHCIASRAVVVALSCGAPPLVPKGHQWGLSYYLRSVKAYIHLHMPIRYSGALSLIRTCP